MVRPAAPAWGSAPLSLQHQVSNGSSVAPTDTPGDTPTANLLGAGPWRTSSGWGDADDLPLPDPHNRTPRSGSAGDTPARGSPSRGSPQDGAPRQQPLARQLSWHQRELAAQQQRREAQRRQREEAPAAHATAAHPAQHQRSGAAATAAPPATAAQPAAVGAAPPAAAAAAAAHSRGGAGDRPRRHTSPFLNLRHVARTWEPLDPETGGERGEPSDAWRGQPYRKDPGTEPEQPAPAAGPTANGSHPHICLHRGVSNAGTEMGELGRQRSDVQGRLSRTTSGVRHISDKGSADLDVMGSRRTSTYGELDPEVEYAGTTKASSLPGLIGNALGLRIPHVGGPAYQAASGAKAGPHTFKWNQNPFVSFRDVWQSLPRVARVLLVWVLLEAIFIVVYATTVLVTKTSQQFIFPLLITGVFLTYLVWDAVLLENTTQLFASMLLALAISAARIVSNSVGKETLNFKGQAVGWFILIMHAITIVLALVTWRDFGWRLHSRLGVDFRRKGATERRHVYSAQAVFVTLVKFDVMWEISLTAVAIALAKAHSSNMPQAERLLAINLTGLGTNLIIGWGAWTVVRHRTFRTLYPIVDVLMPISFLQPALTLALVTANGWEKWNAAYWDSLVVSAPLLIFSRAAVWICMHYILWRIKKLEGLAGITDDDADLLRHNTHLHEELLPLLRGAWLGKPSHASPRKRCFFQLSADGSTLRWSWNKFVRLYYVDEIVCNDAAMTITITMTVDRDLRLQFSDRNQFQAWSLGLERALSMLMGPGGAGPETPASLLRDGGGSGGMIRTESGGRMDIPSTAGRGTRSRVLQTLGINFTRMGGSGTGGGRNRSSDGAKRSPRVESRWQFWRQSTEAAATPLSPRTEVRVDRLQRVRRMQMAHYLDALRRAVAPPPESVAPPFTDMPAHKTPEAAAVEAAELDEIARLPPSAARQGRGRSRPPSGPLSSSDGAQALSRPDLETPSMVWARIQAAQQAQRPDSPPPAPPPISSSASGVWAHIMAGKATASGGAAEDQENVAPTAPRTPLPASAGGALGAMPVPEARPLAPDEAPIGRSVTDMWALLQSGKPIVQEVAHPPPITTPSGGLQALQNGDGASPGVLSTPGTAPSPTVDSVLHSIWVDIIDKEELRFGRRLGAGAQGEVYAAWWRNKPVAVKKFARAADAVHEVQMHLCAGQHTNIVELRALCQHDQALYMVMEFFPRGTLEVMLHHTAAKRWDTAKLLLIIRSIASGLQYLHTRSPPILHRDIKPGNLFVGVNQTIKIGDFGMSRFVGADSVATATGRRTLNRNLTVDIIGTAHYASPEMLNDELLEGVPEDMSGMRHLKIDVYAFGVTLWEMLMRQRPHGDLHAFQIQGMVLLNPEELVLPPVRIPEDMLPHEKAAIRGLADLVVQCTAFSPDHRPSFADILQTMDDIWSSFANNAEQRALLAETSPNRVGGALLGQPPPRGGVAQLLRGHSRKGSFSRAQVPDLERVSEASHSVGHSRQGSMSQQGRSPG